MTPDGFPVDRPAWAVRPEAPVDLDQVHELHRAAFGGPAEAELVDAIRQSPFHLADGSIVAVTADGSVLGHVLLSQVALAPDTGDDAVPILALAPLAVLPAHQGRGIGSALMRAAMAAADERPEPMTVVLGDPAYYGRFGFAPALPQGLRGPYDAAGDAFGVRPRGGTGEISPGTVVYPPAFSAVDG